MDDDSRWRILLTAKLENDAAKAFELFRERGIEPLLIKGWAAARNYPKENTRFYSDVDLAVSVADFDLANEILKSETGRKVNVDLHRGLRHLDTKPWTDLFSASKEIELSGAIIRIPSDEDHLRIMAVHWLTDGGAPKERLWDIYYAVQNRPETFDWDRCLNSVSQVRQGWVIAAISLAHKYLDLEIEELPFAEQARNLPAWLVSAVEKEWRSGVPLRSLHIHLNKPGDLFKQIRKRIPPNPIQATIEMEGPLDNGVRLGYQIRSIVKRALPSIRGISATIRNRL